MEAFIVISLGNKL